MKACLECDFIPVVSKEMNQSSLSKVSIKVITFNHIKYCAS
jgi:hypothetical protein